MTRTAEFQMMIFLFGFQKDRLQKGLGYLFRVYQPTVSREPGLFTQLGQKDSFQAQLILSLTTVLSLSKYFQVL